MKIYLGIVVFGLATAACGDSGGGDSGVDGSKKINALSSSEVQTFCGWALAEQGGPGHETMCNGGFTITAPTEMECESNYGNLKATCTVTVSDAEACIHALAADPCMLGGTACRAVIECSSQVTPGFLGSRPGPRSRVP
jgi:hypothetical protein